MPFEVFEQKRVISDRPIIGIQANGAMRLNKAATAHLCEAETVNILWDRKLHKLAIAGASSDDRRAYRVDYSNGGARIVPRAFLKSVGFNAVSTVHIGAEFLEGMLQATLPTENLASEKTPGPKAAQKRSGRKKKGDS